MLHQSRLSASHRPIGSHRLYYSAIAAERPASVSACLSGYYPHPQHVGCCPATGQVVAEAARPTCRVLAGHQIGRPKPYAQRRVRARHDRSHRQSGVTAALAAAQDARTICEAERLSRRLTMGANEPVAPASLLQVAGTGRIVREKSLELWQRLWEPKIATLVNVHEHGRTLPLVAVGDNRIGKGQCFINHGFLRAIGQ